MMRCMLAVALILVPGALCAEQQELKVYFAPKVAKPPVIDGKLDDACWQQCPPSKEWGFPAYGSRPKEIQQTTFQIGWDDRSLYLGLTAKEPDMKSFLSLISNTAKSIFWRDCFEVHLDGNHDRRTKVQIIANSRNENIIIRTYDPGWGLMKDSSFGLWARWELKGAESGDGWTIEMALSHKAFETRPEEGCHFGINVARFRFVGGPAEFYTWSNHGASHHHASLFGTVILVSGEVENLESGLRIAYPDLDKRSFLIPLADGYLVLDKGRRSNVSYKELVVREVRQVVARFGEAEVLAKSLNSQKATEALRKGVSGLEAETAKHESMDAALMRKLRKQAGELMVKIDKELWNLRIAGLFAEGK